MKLSPALLLVPALLATGAVRAAADTPPPPRDPLRPVAECIDTTRINEWYIVDNSTVTVRTGPKRYLVKTQHTCPKLGRYGPGISFHPSNDKQATLPGRICGDVGETVSSRAQPPCGIQSVQRIDKKRFDQFTRQALRHGSGAEQNLPAGTANP
jgi:hypothetical protein